MTSSTLNLVGLLLLLTQLFSALSTDAQSLLYHYQFDSASLVEASGAHSLSAFGGVSPASDRFGTLNYSYAVDGSSFSELSSPVLGTAQVSTAFTIAAWIYITTPAVDQKIFGHFDAPNFSGPLMGVNAGSLDGEIVGSAQTRFTMGTIPTATWVHVALTWEQNGSFIGYMNGVVVGSVAAMSGTVPVGTGSTQNHLGSAPWDAFYFVLNGSIDDVRMYDYSLSDSAVAALACPLSLSTAGVATGITATSADLSWISGGGAVHKVEYGTAGFSLGSGTGATSVATTLSLSGLTPVVDYEFYISDSCSLLSSPWAGPFSFTTLSMPCDTPVSVSVDAVSTSTADISWVATDPVDLEWGLAGFTLGSGTVANGISSPYTLVGLSEGTAYDFYLSQVCSFGSSDTVGPFSFSTDDSCIIVPLSPAASGLTNVSATIDWTSASGAVSTDMEWGPEFFGLGLGTGTLLTGVTSPFELVGLSPSASYDVYLRHQCAVEPGPWVGPLNFTTISVGMEDVFDTNLKLLVNASGRNLMISWSASFDATINLYDEVGRKISAEQLAGFGASSSTILSVNDPGFYLLEVYSPEKNVRKSYKIVFPY